MLVGFGQCLIDTVRLGGNDHVRAAVGHFAGGGGEVGVVGEEAAGVVNGVDGRIAQFVQAEDVAGQVCLERIDGSHSIGDVFGGDVGHLGNLHHVAHVTAVVPVGDDGRSLVCTEVDLVATESKHPRIIGLVGTRGGKDVRVGAGGSIEQHCTCGSSVLVEELLGAQVVEVVVALARSEDGPLVIGVGGVHIVSGGSAGGVARAPALRGMIGVIDQSATVLGGKGVGGCVAQLIERRHILRLYAAHCHKREQEH